MSDLPGRLLCDMDEAGSAVLVLSPHLDDAVWSCGALLAHLAPRHRITVVTAFTAASPRSARVRKILHVSAYEPARECRS